MRSRLGEPGKTLVGGLGCLAVANMFAAIKTSDELHEMNVSVDDQGTTFTSPTLQRVLSATLQLMLGLTLLAWGYQGTGSTWPSDGFARLFIVLLLAMGTTLVSYGVFKVYDLKNPAFIRLDPSGIRFRQGISPIDSSLGTTSTAYLRECSCAIQRATRSRPTSIHVIVESSSLHLHWEPATTGFG
jgi:hypothetical protein